MRFSDVFTAQALAFRLENDPSNALPFLGEAFFPVRKKVGIDLKWIKAHKGLGVELKPSTYDALATIRPREGFTVLAEEMPLFRESMKVSEQDMVDIQRAQDSNDPYVQDAINHVYDDVNNLVNGARIATERMRMSLLAPTTGDMKIQIGLADNTIYNYNYDPAGAWKSNNYLALTGGATWDNPTTAKPLNDIQTAIDALADKGYTARYAMMNSATLAYLVEADQMKNALISVTGRAIDFLDTATAKDVFQRKTGLTPIIYNKKFKNVSGIEQKFYPNDYVTVIAESQLGNTFMGMTPEERTLMGDPKVDVSIMDSGIAIAIQNIYGPPVRHETTVSQIALPSFEGMDGVFEIKVK